MTKELKGNFLVLALLIYTLSSSFTLEAVENCLRHAREIMYGGIRVELNNFTTNRRLFSGSESYDNVLYQPQIDKSFTESLFRLSPDETWLDMGAGKGLAIMDYIYGMRRGRRTAKVYLRGKVHKNRANTVAYGMVRPSLGAIENPAIRVRYKSFFKDHSRYIEDDAFNLPGHEIPKVKLISDLFGPFSYTDDPSGLLQIYLDKLEVGGEIFIYSNNLGIKDSGIQEWLSFFQGVEASSFIDTIYIKKTSKNTKVRQLKLEQFLDDAPPKRVYRISPIQY